ncbi:3-phosphoglycerate dehydrogenase [Alkalibaculum sp. M08DMB]|uniref:D-3-phosphoglycerate dehydrogenase n=1 Tax=Alkalibaculum sporogenes TaxID=2655001 RepID=A0A6A7KC37_9FIRM|nr:phosphoglycerate dehydrogenase [Alkalibaculum sporogenes]MPW27109.1 3-phosphoglycerate dehydrogenase [Alkalibaculum sporogenes]
MYKIRTLDNISQDGLKLLNSNYNITESDNDADGILLRSFKMHDMDLSPSVKIIARAGAGVNNIPIERYSEEGVVVCNTPGANANAVKELVVLGLLLSSRRVVEGIKWVRTVKDDKDVSKLVEKEKSKFAGQELTGKKLGVIGLGAIGVMVSNIAISLGMEVYGYDPFISIESAWGLSCDVQRVLNLDQIMTECDYITLHVPLIEQTKNLMNKEKFALSKNGIRLLNFARGGLVNHNDLKEAIQNGQVHSYVTDFPDCDLLNMDNVINIPHLGASTYESEENCAKMAVSQTRDYLENGNIINSVNYPDCFMGMSQSKGRIAINHKNIPNMLGQISSILANQNINIADMLNKSKGDYAYTLIDVDSDINGNVTEPIKAIEGVLRVRVIKKD